MRRTTRHLAGLSFLLVALSCRQADEPEAPAAEVAPDPIAQLSPAARDQALDLGSAAAGRLAGTLIQNLTAAMNEGGPAAAIEFCSTQAMPLTEQTNAALRGMTVKRTSSRIRNPANRPDSLEALALAWFEEQAAATDSIPPFWLQPEGATSVRFYRPLVANELCVQCHGPSETLAPEVTAILAERYPDDEATGYAPGHLRGLLRVSVPLGGRE
jgi:hypothetical protein